MLGKISTRLTIIFGLFVFLLTMTFVSGFYVLNQQDSDGLLINLAGRQRMLSQKLTKEVLLYSAQTDDSAKLNHRDQIIETAQVFEVTLLALKDGGAAPLSPKMDSKMQDCPSASGETKAQLNKVSALWVPFNKNIQAYISSNQADKDALAYIQSHNVELLGEMNKAVGLMQGDAESKVGALYLALGLSLGLGVLLFIVTLVLIRKQISTPLDNLSKAANDLSLGELDQEITVQGLTEINKLSKSFERLRVSMVAMIDQNEVQHADQDFDALEGL